MTLLIEQRSQLRRIVDETNLLPLFPNDEDLSRLVTRLEEFFSAYGQRMARMKSVGLPRTITLDGFLREYQDNPYRVKTVLQAMAFLCTPEMLSMVWMVLLGSVVERLSYKYVRRDASKLVVEITLPNGVTRQKFVSEEHWDTALLRFAAISKVDENPMIEGFYPLNISKRSR